MVPETLETWTLEAIRKLVDEGVFESRLFDFKETLPVAADERGKVRLRKSLAAFGNSPGGGFLIFGVKDDRGLAADDRLVGVDPTLDLPVQLKDQGSGCIPRVQWHHRAPPHRLASGRLVHVVQVLEGTTKPHGVFDGERWVFPKRTDGGNDLLSYEEIRDAFRDQRAFRAALRTIKSEADRIEKHARDVNAQLYHRSETLREDLALLLRPGLLESTLPQVLGYLEADEHLLRELALLRGATAAADSLTVSILEGGGRPEPLAKLLVRVMNSAHQVSAAIDRHLAKVPR